MALRVGVLISGSGTNLQAIIDAIADGRLDAEVRLVVSSRADAYGLKRAEKAGIPTMTIARELYDQPEVVDQILASELMQTGCEYVVMAGYMRKVGPAVLTCFEDKVINIHPALLPSFAGAHGIADAFNAGVKVTGVTIHFANAVYDEGPIIAQRAVQILEEDTIETLEPRIHDVEHELYPEVLQEIAENRVHIVKNDIGRRIVKVDAAR